MSAARENPHFRAWAEAVLRFRWLVLLGMLAVTAFFVVQIREHLRFDSSVEYFAAGSEAHDVLKEFHEDFGNDTYHVVMIRGDVFTTEFLDRLRVLHEALADFEFDQAPAAEGGGEQPAAPAGEDGWGSEDDALGFGAAPAAGSGGAGASDDGWGGGDDALGFGGDPPDNEAATASEIAPSASGEWGEGGSLIEEIVSLINVRQTVFEDGAVRVRGLLEDGTPPADELAALKAQVLGDPTLSGYVVGADGEHAVIMLRTNSVDFEGRSAIYRALKDHIKDYDTEGFRLSVSGMPALNAELVDTMQVDMRRLIAAAFVVMALILGWLFRHPVAVLAPLTVVAMAAIWTLGSMAYFHVPVTLLTNIVPAFLACVALGDSIHIQSIYRDGVSRGQSNHEALVSAIGSTGMPVLFTTLTTAVGLLSFRFADMDAIAEMGSFAAFGVMVALLLSLTVLPVVLSTVRGERLVSAVKLQAPGVGERSRDWTDRLLEASTALSAKRSWPVLSAGALLMIVAAIGIDQIRVYHNPVEWLAEDYPARVELERLDESIGGTAQVNVVIKAPGERGLADLELLQGLEKLDRHMRAFKHPLTGERIVTGSSSLLDIIRETNRALHEGDQAYYALPETQRGVSDNLFLFESAAPQDLRRLATADLKKSHITLRLHWMDATSYKPFTEWIDQGIDEFIGDRADVRPTGSVYELTTTVSGLINDLIRSFTAALVSVTLMMVLLLRSPTLGLVSMIPNLVPVALVMGFMGFANIPLDLTNLLIASIVIGVAVDNTVHYVFQWKIAWEDGAGTEGGIDYALEHAGRALVGTAMILALGFGVYLASSMLNIRRFGMLIAAACVFALFTNLIFAPALLRSLFGRGDPTPRG